MNATQILFVASYVLVASIVLLCLRFLLTTLMPVPVIRFKPCRYDDSFITLRLSDNRSEARNFLSDGMICRDLNGAFREGRQFWVKSCDVSMGGVGFVGDCRVPKGTEMEIKFNHEGRLISFTGKVVWTKKVKGNQFCGGVQFHPGQIPA